MNPGGSCELDENKICDGCNECNRCDLDPNKLCDSCGKCLDMDDSEYKEICIEGILSSDIDADDYVWDSDSATDDSAALKEDFEGGVVYIEDIPELKKKCDEELQRILQEIGQDEIEDKNED